MRRARYGLCFLLLASAAFSDALPKLLLAASAASPTYATLDIDRELAELKAEKSRIEARRERDRLSAEATLLAALESYRKSLRDFCDGVIDAVFDVAVAEVGVRIAAISEATARENELAAEAQYGRGLLSDESRTNARLESRSARLSVDQAAWTLQEARRALEATTGLAWQASLLPEVPDLVVPEDPGVWTSNDLGLKRAEVADRLAALDMTDLPGNAAPYDRRIAEAAVRKARTALDQARRSSERSFRSAAETLRSRKEAISLKGDDVSLQQSLLADAERRYQRSAIARGELDQQRIRVLNAEKARLEAVRSLVLQVVSYLISTGVDPRVAP